MDKIDLNELAKSERYEATIAHTVTVQARTERHLQLARFYLTALGIFLMGAAALGLLIYDPDPNVSEWARTILSSFASAAIGFQAGKAV